MQDLNTLHRLEWYWKMKYSSLNLDSHYNIFCLEATNHIHFDKNGWLLLPHPDVLARFKSAVTMIGGRAYAERGSFPEFDANEHFLYKFVLLKGWEHQLIWRIDNNTGSSLSFTTSEHPFTKLPYLKSHLRPQFAIFNAGFKLKQRTLEEQKDIIDGSPDLVFIMDLYDAWTAVLPEGHHQDQSYDYPVEPSSHDNVDDVDDDVGFVVDDDEDPDYHDKKRKRQKVPSRKPKQKRPQKT